MGISDSVCLDHNELTAKSVAVVVKPVVNGGSKSKSTKYKVVSVLNFTKHSESSFNLRLPLDFAD
jgi:hypothetical protein